MSCPSSTYVEDEKYITIFESIETKREAHMGNLDVNETSILSWDQMVVIYYMYHLL
jgi:hypothetical protein